jgi:hypothetical protein
MPEDQDFAVNCVLRALSFAGFSVDLTASPEAHQARVKLRDLPREDCTRQAINFLFGWIHATDSEHNKKLQLLVSALDPSMTTAFQLKLKSLVKYDQTGGGEDCGCGM